MATVILIDQGASIRASLRRALAEAGYSVRTYAQAGQFLRNGRPDEPACLVLDVQIPDMSGIELQERLVTLGPEIPIVFATGCDDVGVGVRAMKLGAVDFLTTPVEADGLLDAVRRAVERDARNRARQHDLALLRRRYRSLTPREREVFSAVTSGMLNKQVGFALGVAEATVKVHRARIMEKLGAASLAQLVRFADALGVQPPAPVAAAG